MAPLVFQGRAVSFACFAGGFFSALEVAVEVFVEVAGKSGFAVRVALGKLSLFVLTAV
jgi:hypothetical protein